MHQCLIAYYKMEHQVFCCKFRHVNFSQTIIVIVSREKHQQKAFQEKVRQ